MEALYQVAGFAAVAGGLVVFVGFKLMQRNDPAAAARVKSDAENALEELKQELKGLRDYVKSKLP